MASNLILHSGSPLIGSPIVYQVTAGSPGTGIETTFQRVKLYVYAALSGDTEYKEFLFSQPVSKGETVKIDISSALQAVADRYEYSPQLPASFPFVSFNLKACDEWMINGVNSGDVNIVSNAGGKALPGHFSEFERLKAGDSGRNVLKFSRKPSYKAGCMAETVCVGDTYVYYTDTEMSIGNITSGPVPKTFKIYNEGVNAGTVLLYALPENTPDRYLLRFVNSMGVLEDINVLSLMSSEVEYKSKEYILSRPETFGQVGRSLVSKEDDRETWTLSSGPLDKAWQQWFLHEVLMAKWVWIYIDETWIPCHIMTEETIKGIDREKPSMLEVQFNVKLDIAGSPFASMLT